MMCLTLMQMPLVCISYFQGHLCIAFVYCVIAAKMLLEQLLTVQEIYIIVLKECMYCLNNTSEKYVFIFYVII